MPEQTIRIEQEDNIYQKILIKKPFGNPEGFLFLNREIPLNEKPEIWRLHSISLKKIIYIST